MRLKLSLLAFALAILFGVSFSRMPTLAYEWYAPAFTRQEAESLVGKYVRNAEQTEFTAMQCSESGRICSETKVGARGIIKAVKEIKPNRYFIIVQWEGSSNGEAILSYCGRMTARVSLRFEETQR